MDTRCPKSLRIGPLCLASALTLACCSPTWPVEGHCLAWGIGRVITAGVWAGGLRCVSIALPAGSSDARWPASIPGPGGAEPRFASHIGRSMLAAGGSQILLCVCRRNC